MTASKTDCLLDELAKMKSQTNDWNLSDDVKLAHFLSRLSDDFQNRISSVSRTIESLEHDFAVVECDVRLTCDELTLRGENQFLENCVANDDDPSPLDRNDRVETTARACSFTANASRRALEEEPPDTVLANGMKALSLFFDPNESVARGLSVMEDSCYYYDSMRGDEFNYRPLPYVIGTTEFRNSSYAGLAEETKSSGRKIKDKHSISNTSIENGGDQISVASHMSLAESNQSSDQSSTTDVQLIKSNLSADIGFYRNTNNTDSEDLEKTIEDSSKKSNAFSNTEKDRCSNINVVE